MLTPLALFVGLLVATAFIAHWSDNLGKKLGKKRVSVLGLRPRHSATLLTIASSWGIMIFTLVALLVTVAPLRRALFRYDAVRTQLTQITGEFQEVQSRLQKAQSRLQNVQSQREVALKQKGDALKIAKLAQEDSQKARGAAKKSRDQTREAQRNFRSARRGELSAKSGARIALISARRFEVNARQAQGAASTARAQEAAARQALLDTQTQLGKSQAELETAKLTLINAKIAVTKSYTAVAKSYKTVAISSQKVATANAQVEKANAQAERSKKDAQAQVQKAQAEVDELELQRSNLTKQIAALREQSKDELARTLIFASGNIQVSVGQTLAERRFDVDGSIPDVERQLRLLIESSQEAAQKLIPGTKVIARTIGTDPSTGKVVDLDEDQTVRLYSQFLVKAKQSVSARLVSSLNYPADSPEILGRFFFVPIRTIYIAGENIGEATIDARKSESAIFGDLQRLLDTARLNAVKRDASPPLSPIDQTFFDGDTGQKMLNALHQVQKMGQPVRVRIVAARDLDVAEPLQVRFVVGDDTA